MTLFIAIWVRLSDIPPDLQLIIGLFVITLVFLGLHYLVGRRRIKALNVEKASSVKLLPSSQKKIESERQIYTSEDGVKYAYALEPVNMKAICPQPECNTPLEIIERNNSDNEGNHRVVMQCPWHQGWKYGEIINADESDFPRIRKHIIGTITKGLLTEGTTNVAQLTTRTKELEKETEQRRKRIERLEQDISTLQVRHSVREGERDALQTKLDALNNEYGWLHNLADNQAKDISEFIEVKQIFYCPESLTNDMPRIKFGVHLHNKSVFEIVIEDIIEGHIEIAGHRLLSNKQFLYKHHISASSNGDLTIEQRLSREEVQLIASRMNDEEGAIFYFDKLIIMAGISASFTQDGRASLKLPQRISHKDEDRRTKK